MKIEGIPKEIADLVVILQGQQEEKKCDYAINAVPGSEDDSKRNKAEPIENLIEECKHYIKSRN